MTQLKFGVTAHCFNSVEVVTKRCKRHFFNPKLYIDTASERKMAKKAINILKMRLKGFRLKSHYL